MQRLSPNALDRDANDITDMIDQIAKDNGLSLKDFADLQQGKANETTLAKSKKFVIDVYNKVEVPRKMFQQVFETLSGYGPAFIAITMLKGWKDEAQKLLFPVFTGTASISLFLSFISSLADRSKSEKVKKINEDYKAISYGVNIWAFMTFAFIAIYVESKDKNSNHEVDGKFDDTLLPMMLTALEIAMFGAIYEMLHNRKKIQSKAIKFFGAIPRVVGNASMIQAMIGASDRNETSHPEDQMGGYFGALGGGIILTVLNYYAPWLSGLELTSVTASILTVLSELLNSENIDDKTKLSIITTLTLAVGLAATSSLAISAYERCKKPEGENKKPEEGRALLDASEESSNNDVGSQEILPVNEQSAENIRQAFDQAESGKAEEEVVPQPEVLKNTYDEVKLIVDGLVNQASKQADVKSIVNGLVDEAVTQAVVKPIVNTIVDGSINVIDEKYKRITEIEKRIKDLELRIKHAELGANTLFRAASAKAVARDQAPKMEGPKRK